jgi:hypothetical protein
MKIRAVAFVLAIGLVVAALPAATASAAGASPGYVVVSRAGSAFAFGGVKYEGSPITRGFDTDNVVDTQVLTNGNGYWIVTSTGLVEAFGQAKFYGSAHAAAPIVGIAATPDDLGYWLIDQDGDIAAFGDAHLHGSLPDAGLSVHNVVAMAATADGKGYYVANATGSVYSFGDTAFVDRGRALFGSPTASIALDGVTGGFWLVSAKGGIYAFHARYYGASPTPIPIVGIAATPDSAGYWFVNDKGTVFVHGDAAFFGSVPSTAAPIVAIGSD